MNINLQWSLAKPTNKEAGIKYWRLRFRGHNMESPIAFWIPQHRIKTAEHSDHHLKFRNQKRSYCKKLIRSRAVLSHTHLHRTRQAFIEYLKIKCILWLLMLGDNTFLLPLGMANIISLCFPLWRTMYFPLNVLSLPKALNNIQKAGTHKRRKYYPHVVHNTVFASRFF